MELLIALLLAAAIGGAVVWLRARRARVTYEDIDGYWEALQRVSKDAPLGSSGSGHVTASPETKPKPESPETGS